MSRFAPAFIVPVMLAVLGGCATAPGPDPGRMPAPRAGALSHPPLRPELPAAGSGRGGYYQDDGPGDAPPADLRELPDAQVRAEPYSRYANRPYAVFGKSYTPIANDQPFAQRGVSSWYGKKFHGQRTSSGEIYDMYKMTAAHPTLPIPSFARITSMATGRQVVVRINDRGPFHTGRIVDVSYTAALKLGLLSKGSHEVQLERLLPDASERLAAIRRNAPGAPVDAAALMLENRAEIEAVTVQSGVPAAGFYVQMGAFSRAGKAAEIRARIAGQGWAGAALDVVGSGALQRVLGGPFASRAEAQEAARRIPPALGLRPIVIKR